MHKINPDSDVISPLISQYLPQRSSYNVNAITRVAFSNDSSHLMVEVIIRTFVPSGHPSFAFSIGGEQSKICTTHDLLFMNVVSHSTDQIYIAFHYQFKELYWLNEWREFAKTLFTM